MKKSILAIAAFALLSITTVNAQRGHYPNQRPTQAPQYDNPRIDNAYEELSINRLDNIVKLSRKQENELKRIENKYDRLLRGRRISNRDIQRFENEKQKTHSFEWVSWYLQSRSFGRTRDTWVFIFLIKHLQE